MSSAYPKAEEIVVSRLNCIPLYHYRNFELGQGSHRKGVRHRKMCFHAIFCHDVGAHSLYA